MSTCSRSHARRIATLLTVLGAVTMAACKAGAGNVGTDISTSQAVLDLGQSIADLREENGLLQEQVDSLHRTLAYQDSVLRQVAAITGVGMRPPAVQLP